MEMFEKSISLYDLRESKFFKEWYRAIINDMERFLTMIDDYKECEYKMDLKNIVTGVVNDLYYFFNFIFNTYDNVDESFLIDLKNTENYFLFSYMGEMDEVPKYILLSKNYDKFLFIREEMECFDDPSFNEELRYGLCDFDYFRIINNKVFRYSDSSKMYTEDYYEYLSYGSDKTAQEIDKCYARVFDYYERKRINGKGKRG